MKQYFPWTRALTAAAVLIPTSLFAAQLQGLRPNNPNATTLQLLDQAKSRQIEQSKSWRVFHDFSFTDQWEQSGLNFTCLPVDDAARDFKAVHYDHGCGIAVADVDGDGLLDVFLVGQRGGNGLFRNLGHGKFEDITAKAGVSMKEKICVAASFADIDNDGLPDLYVTTVRFGNQLFKNLGGGKFQDITAQSGLGYVGHSSGAVFFDFNNDGLLDMFLCNVGIYTSDEKGRGGFYVGERDAFTRYQNRKYDEKSILFQNLGGGKFKDVSKEMHLEHTGWSGDATFADVNGDGFPDLYVLSMSGENKFYENDHGKGFVQKTNYFPKTPWGAMGVKFFDWNNDGLLDLYVTDMHSDMTAAQTKAGERDFKPSFAKIKDEPWCRVEWGPAAWQTASNSILGNAFYQNLGNGKFAEVSDKIGAETYWPWGITVADFNADGFDDVYATAGMGYPMRYGVNSLLLNEGGQRFVDAEFVVNAEPPKNNRLEIVYFTLDADGEDRNHPITQASKGHGQLKVIGSTSSRSSVAFDVDGDGDLDLITNDFNDHPRVLLNNLSDKKAVHFLKVKLVGAKSNRDGLGALVKVKAGGRTFLQQNDGKSGYLGQSSMPLYFGLGDANPESVEVTWPSGAKQTLVDLMTSKGLLTVTEPK